jgi:pimeloyl-ACP methyl ester carboxylesterase
MAPWLAGGRPPQVCLVPGAGHFVQNEAPEVVNRALLGFLAP